MRTKHWWIVAVALAACGGAEKKTAAPQGGDDSTASAPNDDDANLIPEEKYEEIKSVFNRKTSMVSRCFVAGVDAGQVDKSQKGFVTVGLTIGTEGKPDDVRILKTSFQSKALADCMVDMVKGWVFTDSLPKPLETSHTYVLDRF